MPFHRCRKASGKNPLPRGEGGPRQRVGRGMRAETGKSAPPCRPTPMLVVVTRSRSSGFRLPNVTARIPLQSPVGSEEPTGDSFSPGEAFSRDPLGRGNDVVTFGWSFWFAWEVIAHGGRVNAPPLHWISGIPGGRMAVDGPSGTQGPTVWKNNGGNWALLVLGEITRKRLVFWTA